MTEHLRALILGAAAGGGLPQWNCGCANCVDARAGNAGLVPQTQSSIAFTADGSDWAVFNASPDIRQQLLDNAVLHPRSLRDTPIAGITLTNGDIDHIAGLLVVREKQPFNIFATREIISVINANPVFGVLDRSLVGINEVRLGQSYQPAPGLTAELFAVPGKVPLYLEGDQVQTDLEGEQTVGVKLSGGDKTAYYIPGCALITPALAERLRGADLVFFDGTVFTDSEMIDTGTGVKTGRRMGHMPVSGNDGSITAFGSLDVERRVFIHINNTNPMWRPGSTARREVEASGWQIAHDGMQVAI